jgi:hypothetical protein
MNGEYFVARKDICMMYSGTAVAVFVVVTWWPESIVHPPEGDVSTKESEV